MQEALEAFFTKIISNTQVRLIVILSFFPTFVFPQNVEERKICESVISEINALLNGSSPEYDLIIQKLQYSQAICQSDSILFDSVNNLIELTFRRINGERIRAEREARLNSRASKANENSLRALQLFKEDPTFALRFAETNYRLFPESSVAQGIFYEISRDENRIFSMAKIGIGHEDSITAISFSSDGNYILSSSIDGKFIIWDLRGKEILKKHTYFPVYDACFSPDGKNVLTTMENVGVLWDLEGNVVRKLQGHSSNILSISFSENGENIISGSLDSKIILWDKKGRKRELFRGHTGPVTQVVFSKDGSRIFSCSKDNTIRLWDLKNRNENGAILFSGNNGSVLESIQLLSPNKLLVREILEPGYSEMRRNTFTIEFSPDLSKKKEGTVIPQIEFLSGNGKLGLSSTEIIEVVKDSSLGFLEEPFYGLSEIILASFSPKFNYLVTAHDDSKIFIWNLEGKTVKALNNHSSVVTDVSFTEDEKNLITISFDSTARLWDLKGDLIRDFGEFVGEKYWASLTFDKKNLFKVSSDSVATLLNFDGSILKKFEGAQYDVLPQILSTDKEKFFSIRGDTLGLIIDFEGKIWGFLGGLKDLRSGIFHHDNETMYFINDMDSSFYLWGLR